MTERTYLDYVQDILDAINEIQEFLEDKIYPDFLKDRKTFHAVVHCLEIIGEASKKTPVSIQKSHSEIPWKQMGDMRNLLIHGYFTIDSETIWETAKHDLPPVKIQIQKLISSLKS